MYYIVYSGSSQRKSWVYHFSQQTILTKPSKNIGAAEKSNGFKGSRTRHILPILLINAYRLHEPWLVAYHLKHETKFSDNIHMSKTDTKVLRDDLKHGTLFRHCLYNRLTRQCCEMYNSDAGNRGTREVMVVMMEGERGREMF